MRSSAQTALFAYGSLQIDSVIRHVVGRVPPRTPARLEGYARYRVKGADYPGIVPDPGASLEGCLFEGITPAEWDALDTYEDWIYDRVQIQVIDMKGRACPALAYVVPDHHRHLLSDQPWNLNDYNRSH